MILPINHVSIVLLVERVMYTKWKQNFLHWNKNKFLGQE